MTYQLIITVESRYDEKEPIDVEYLRTRAEVLAAHLATVAAAIPDLKLHFTVTSSTAEKKA